MSAEENLREAASVRQLIVMEGRGKGYLNIWGVSVHHWQRARVLRCLISLRRGLLDMTL